MSSYALGCKKTSKYSELLNKDHQLLDYDKAKYYLTEKWEMLRGVKLNKLKSTHQMFEANWVLNGFYFERILLIFPL